ncbi:MAG: DUF4240 domain-containing protein [Myxococcota bacterium]
MTLTDRSAEADVERALFALLTEARAHAENAAGRVAWLRAHLRRESPERIEAYADAFESLLERADRWPLFAVSLMVFDSRDPEVFRAFRAWVVSLGPEVYAAALEDPDALAEALAREAPQDPALLPVFRESFLEVTGRALPEPTLDLFGGPQGEPLLDSELPVRFPRVAAALRGH